MQTTSTNKTVRKRISHLALGLVMSLLCVLAMSNAASASTSQKAVMQDDGHLLSPDAPARDAALDEMKKLGVDIVKIGAFWRTYAPEPTSRSKPNADTANPATYSWGVLASAIDGILARGMQPWVMISAPAPDWATGQSTSDTQEGVYQPDPVEFGKFSEAIAKQFPQVNIWSEGNEPNFQYWLWPQMGKGLVSLSAVHYRKLYYEGRAGLQRGGAGRDQILFGALAPRAFLPKVGQRATQPLRFLRDFFCLGEDLKPLKGAAAKARSCTGKYKRIEATGFAYHPYTVAGGPLVKANAKDDAPILYLKRVYRILDKAAAHKRLSKRRIPLWNAEFGYQSNPPDAFQTSIAKIPGFLNTAEYISYKDPRVKTYHQFQLIDEPENEDYPVGNSRRYGGFQSGLRFADGTKKFGVYNGYELPLMVFKTGSRNQVNVWGGIRNKHAGAVAIEIQIKQGNAFNTIKTLNVTAANGYFNTQVNTSGAASKQYRFVVGNNESRTTKPSKPVKASSQ